MIDLTNNPASIEKPVPVDKLFSLDTINKFQIESAVWLMTIKPGVRLVTPYIDGRTRLEEIEVLRVRCNTLPDTHGYRYLLSEIHKRISYPCVVFFEYQDKYKISAWKFLDSIRADHNILKTSYVSAWIREPPASNKTEICASGVQRLLLHGEGSIKDLYDQVCQLILNCAPQYIGSRVHLMRIITSLAGSESFEKKIDHTKRFALLNPTEKYKKNVYGSAFRYIYEYEDIWYALMNDEKMRTIIEKRRYRDMEDLVFQIDSRYEDRRY